MHLGCSNIPVINHRRGIGLVNIMIKIIISKLRIDKVTVDTV